MLPDQTQVASIRVVSEVLAGELQSVVVYAEDDLSILEGGVLRHYSPNLLLNARVEVRTARFHIDRGVALRV